MKKDEALSLAEKRSWEQTKFLLGPVPEVSEGTDVWFAQRDQFFNEIISELEGSGIIESEESL